MGRCRIRYIRAFLSPGMDAPWLAVYYVASVCGNVFYYALGIVVAMIAGMVFTRTILKPDVSSAFVLELPPYRQPALKNVLIHMWENTREFVRKAGTTILLASIAMWILLNLPWGVKNQQDSYFGKFSGAIAPVFTPLGFGNWETGGALVSGFMAKEIVVSAMSQIYLGDMQSAAVGPEHVCRGHH